MSTPMSTNIYVHWDTNDMGTAIPSFGLPNRRSEYFGTGVQDSNSAAIVERPALSKTPIGALEHHLSLSGEESFGPHSTKFFDNILYQTNSVRHNTIDQ